MVVVDDRDAKAVTEEIVALSSRAKLPALHGTPRSPAELVMCEANVGEEIVRQMVDAVDLVAKQPHVDAVKDFSVKIVTAIGDDAEGAAGTSHETFNTIVATLSPLAKEFTKTGQPVQCGNGEAACVDSEQRRDGYDVTPEWAHGRVCGAWGARHGRT